MKHKEITATVFLPDRQFGLFSHEVIKPGEILTGYEIKMRVETIAEQISLNFGVPVTVVFWRLLPTTVVMPVISHEHGSHE